MKDLLTMKNKSLMVSNTRDAIADCNFTTLCGVRLAAGFDDAATLEDCCGKIIATFHPRITGDTARWTQNILAKAVCDIINELA